MRGRCGTPQEISIPHGTIKTDVAQMNNQFNEISIPHGTIKTYGFCFWLYTCCFISIPHGTIKTFDIKAVRNLDTKFQFHMVRLRHDRGARPACRTPISIPHGTIKTPSACSTFLTAWISIPHGTIKTYAGYLSTNLTLISIPHGTIKTGINPPRAAQYSHFNSTWYD